MRVTNIKIEEIDFATSSVDGSKKDKAEYKKTLDCIRYMGYDPEKLIPKGKQHRVYCVIQNTYSSFANALRRCIQGDLDIKGLHIEGHQVLTDDKFILKDDPRDELVRSINSIPINQNINWDSIELSVDVTNTEDTTMTVCSSDIKVSGGHKMDKLFSNTIEITELRPGKRLKIKSIQVVTRKNRYDGAFCAVDNILYWPLNDEKKGVLVQNPTSFEFGYTTYRCSTDKPEQYMHMACDSLLERVGTVLEEIKKTDAERVSNNIVKIDQNDVRTVFTINGEHWSMGNLLAHACLLEDPTTDVVPSIQHPSIEEAIVTTTSREPIKLLKNAIGSIIKDLTYFRKQF